MYAGAPARTVGWRDPGFIHTGFLKELWPNSVYVTMFHTSVFVFAYTKFFSQPLFCRYTYKLGHKLLNGSLIWSKVYQFKSSPYPGQDSLQRVIIFGDMGKVRTFILIFFFWFNLVSFQYCRMKLMGRTTIIIINMAHLTQLNNLLET